MSNEGKEYVKVPWNSFIPHAILLIVSCSLVFIDTGIIVFHMPVETFIVNWLTFPYVLFFAFLHISKGKKVKQ